MEGEALQPPEIPQSNHKQIADKPEEKINLKQGEYDLREFTDQEKVMLENAKTDFHQLKEIQELLSRAEFVPSGVLRVDDKKFFVGDVLQTENRDMAIFYFEDSNGNLIPRFLYKSKSDGSWRSCPWVDRFVSNRGNNKDRFSKGKSIHYTQETKPHEDIVRYLEQVSASGRRKDLRGEPVDTVYQYFLITDEMRNFHSKPEWNTYDQEVMEYYDEGALDQFRKFPPGNYGSEALKKLGYGNARLSKEFSSFDFSDARLQGFLPDFQVGPFKTTKTDHTLLGDTTLEYYKAALNGRPIGWVMAYDDAGRVWIERIAFLDTKINSYGVSSEVIDSGALTNKPLEYKDYATGLEENTERKQFKRDEAYVDITPLLDHLLPVINFRQARGIHPERIPQKMSVADQLLQESFQEKREQPSVMQAGLSAQQALEKIAVGTR